MSHGRMTAAYIAATFLGGFVICAGAIISYYKWPMYEARVFVPSTAPSPAAAPPSAVSADTKDGT